MNAIRPQAAIFQPIPDHARHLYFDLVPGVDPRPALAAVAAECDGDTLVLGLGQPLSAALGSAPPGLRAFPEWPQSAVPIPATQHALWLWLRGDGPGDLLRLGHALERRLAGAFRLADAVDCFRHRDSRDLTGYEDGTENPEGEAARAAACDAGGGSYAAIQLWRHDFPAFDAMSREAQNHTIGRDLESNAELDDAPESAHVKRTAQEDFAPEAFVVRRSMPWSAGREAGLVFLAFGKSFDAYEALLHRMTGRDDGVVDALFSISRPRTGGYYWCPPLGPGGALWLERA